MLIKFTLLTIIINAQNPISFDTIEVDAMRIPLKMHQTGRNISVLTATEIASINANSLDEILQQIPGIEVQSRGGFGVQGDILMRGSTFTQVLVLINGVKMNDPLTGHFNGNIPVAKNEIEKIEILRGSGSAMYGADAVGGVINIITKSFSNKKNSPSISGEIGYGQNKLIDGNIGVTHSSDKFVFDANVSISESDGEEIPALTIDTSTTLEAYNTFFDNKTVSASVAYKATERTTIKARTSYDQRDFAARYFYTTSTFDKSVESVSGFFNHLQISHIGNKGVTDVNFSHKKSNDVFVFSPDFPSTNNHEMQFLNFTANHHLTLNEKMGIKFGIQADQRSIESNDRGDHEDLHFGAYGLLAYTKNQFSLITAIRADYDDNYEFEFSPSVNAAYNFEKLTLRTSIGKSIRAADYTERYVSNNLMNLTPGRSLGNPDLKAEKSWSAEFGFDYNASKNWQLSSSVFTRVSDQLIDYVSTNQADIGSVSEVGSLQEGADYFFANNIADVTTLGFEVSSDLQIPIGEKGLFSWNVGYTFVENTNEQDIISVYLSNATKHLISNRFLLRYDNIDFTLSSIFKQRDPRIASGINANLEENYIVFSPKIKYRFSEATYLSAEAINVFDAEYQNILGARMPGRWLRFAFGFKM